MSLINSTAIPSGATGYEIDQSLRLEDGSAAYLNRTPSSASNRKTWTWSGWVKRSNLSLGTDLQLFSTNQQANPFFSLFFRGADTISFVYYNGTYYQNITNAVYRDSSSWYHIVFVFDTTQSTASNRYKLYINGSLVTSYASSNYPPLNTDGTVNNNQIHYISKAGTSGTQYLDGYLAEVNFIDGAAKAPADFGETGTYGEWKPIEYEGSYGTNGFYLNFATAADMGDDKSGNTNDWTENNIAATDQMLDSPTNNFATMNPLDESGVTLSEGNLQASVDVTGNRVVASTFSPSTGKWYVEMFANSFVADAAGIGVCGLPYTSDTSLPYIYSDSVMYYANSGAKYIDGTSSAYGSAFTAGDIIGLAIDLDGNSITFYKNNVSQGAISKTFTGGYTIVLPNFTSTAGRIQVYKMNFGQDSSFAGAKTAQGNQDGNSIGDFYYAPPTGFLALCTSNLPDVAVVPSEHFDVRLRTGTGSEVTVSDLEFQPDLLWTKTRSNAVNHNFHSSLMAQNYSFLQTNSTAAENSSASTYYMTPTSTGYTVGTGDNINQNTYTFVDWLWKAGGGSGSSNTNGSINSTVSANVDAGFSIVSYTGNGNASQTVGHGLSSAPDVMLVKNRDDTDSWVMYHHQNTSEPATERLVLNTTAATLDRAQVWDDTLPTSTVMHIGTDVRTNANSEKYIAYYFHSVDGYSKVGSYTGNGNADGTFVYTGFRPMFVLTKQSSTTGSWTIHDAKRDIDNPLFNELIANGSDADHTSDADMDFTSNGFKIRRASGQFNTNGATVIYLAFAESPFKYSNAR